MSAVVFKGTCLCGHCTYTCEALPTRAGNCHCTTCQRLTGAAFMTCFCVPTSSITWRNRPAVMSSSKTAQRLACDKCHSWMAMTYLATPEEIFLNHSTVNFDAMSSEILTAFKPTYHIFLADKVPWLELVDDLEKFDGDNTIEDDSHDDKINLREQEATREQRGAKQTSKKTIRARI